MKPVEIIVNDLMQKDYRYLLTAPEGECFDPLFKPDITPEKMLSAGVFGGRYMTDCTDEFPKKWFRTARLCHSFHDPELNCFRVCASMPLSEWVRRGWIHPQDPRGWFQWYCRYYYGRRTEDDARQIKRWLAMKRHLAQLKKNCSGRGSPCRAKQRQALLQWAYDTRSI